jgi:hypothetical protein
VRKNEKEKNELCCRTIHETYEWWTFHCRFCKECWIQICC